MRLNNFEIDSIKQTFKEVFDDGTIYLFGSRTNDLQRGGDIDLYLCPTKRFEDNRERKIKFLIKLEELIGEQKIDVIIQKDINRLIEKEALSTGIKL